MTAYRRLALVFFSLAIAGSLLAQPSSANADYLEVRRSATLKAHAHGEAQILARLDPGVELHLSREAQTHGYYLAEAEDGTAGWIYRTLVRRHRGEPAFLTQPRLDDETDPGEEIPAYRRSQWRHWTDDDGDCQDARQEVLIEESLEPVTFEVDDACRVATGRWKDAYDGREYTQPGDLDVDHMIPLKRAHLLGGHAWDAETRRIYANDRSNPDHLVAVSASLNRSKGSRGPAEWRPPSEETWCWYARAWRRVAERWTLATTVADDQALREMEATCPPP